MRTNMRKQTIVAPLAGAWIETRSDGGAGAGKIRVAPLAGAWIETLSMTAAVASGFGVAPLAGAWIETSPAWDGKIKTAVAPLAGAWIETAVLRANCSYK